MKSSEDILECLERLREEGEKEKEEREIDDETKMRTSLEVGAH